MALMGDLLLQAPSTVTLLGALLFMMKYGSVFTVHFGPKKVVVLAGYKTVKQALVNQAEEFGNRDIPRMSRDINQGHGVLFANGDSWREMRRFALTNLRDFGMGKKGAEEKIIEEIPYLIELFEKHKGKAFDTTQPVNYAASNIISAIVYGSRFEYSDSQFRGMLYNMFSWLGPWLKSRKVMLKNVDNNHRDVKELVRGLKESLNPQMCRGFESGNMDSHYHENNLISSVTNLFAAGTDTTGTTLRWDRVQEEISRVIGSRQPLVEDRKNLPYTDAVIHEIQRLANIVPMSIPHATSRDVTFQGYFIKKGTSVIPLLTSVLHDDSEWESPHCFNPSHFLDEQGRFVKRDAFMAFSAGRRVCLGEGLARMELFLFFTSLLQHFSFTPPPGVTEDDLDLTPLLGFTLNPSPHQLCATSSTVTLLGAVLFLLVLYLLSSVSSSEEQWKEPPGPSRCPCLLSKKYVSIFMIHFGPRKVVVVAGYKMVKQALVNHAEEFGDRDITPVLSELNKGHNNIVSLYFSIGILFANGDSWKEMRRFALTNLRDFGMGKKASEEKVIEDVRYLFEIRTLVMKNGQQEGDEGAGFVDSFLIRKQTLEVWRLFTDRVQENINRLIGSRQPLVEDRKNLPYADAVIHEIQRLANIAPMAILHTTSRDITFQGYFIKKGTLIRTLVMKMDNKKEMRELVRGLKETFNL
ncbi:unnamed protein product [Coregonus sp. 'balchen']|nr:unnamed protein product [Coregonus sp. 'balchen']